MKRAINAIKKYGIIGIILKVLKKVMYRVFRFFDRIDSKYQNFRQKLVKKFNNREYAYIEKLCKNQQYKSVYVFYPYSEWNLPVFQRPQQIALSMSKRDDILYIFCSANYNFDNITGLYRKINKNLYLVTDYEFIKNLDIKNRVIHLYSTDIVSKYDEVEEALKRKDKVLYEYIDEIHESITNSAPEYYLEKHKKILKNEKVHVIATADKLLNDVKKVRKKNFALSTNGVNIDDFITDSEELDLRLLEIKEKYDKVICYYGSLAVWFDYELVAKCAKKYPNYAFVLIGIEYDASLKDSKVLNNKNVIYLGKINYNELINFTKDVDLLTIPFLINEVTESTSPVKLFEYMATQKPILTTDMKECRKYKSVLIGKNHEDYIKKVKEAIELNEDTKYKELEMKEALDNTWDSKSEIIINLLNK